MHASVSDLHLCQRCPRLLAFSRAGKSNAWKVGLQGGTGSGSRFHDHIAAPFHRDAAGEGDVKKRTEILKIFHKCGTDFNSLKRELFRFADKNYYTPYINANARQLLNQQIESLYGQTSRWLDFLVDFFRNSSGYALEPKKFAENAFLPTEKLLETLWKSDSGDPLKISGRFDCLLFDKATGEILLVDFKCRKESDPTGDLAQVALYAWLVKQNNGVLPKCGVVYLEEENQAVALYPAQRIEEIIEHFPKLFETAIPAIRDAKTKNAAIPKAADANLCSECFYTEECGQWGAENFRTKAGKERSALTEERPHVQIPACAGMTGKDSESQQRLEQLVDVLQKFKLHVTPDGFVSGPRFIRLKIVPSPEQGVTVSKIQNKAKDIQVSMKLMSAPLIQAQGGYVSVDVPRKKPTILTITPMIQNGQHNRPASDAAVPIGAKIDGDTFWIDLADSTSTSILIGGTSGSGKSVLLQSLVLGLVLANPDFRTEFTLIDPKRVTFTKMPLEKLDAELICDQKPALERLNTLVEEMEQRYVLFANNKCHDIVEFNKMGTERLTRHVVVVDEFADLMVDTKANKELEILIQRIGQKGRAAGLHLILATQRPEAKVVSPLIKANLQLKIALKVTSVANSRLILDAEGAECLIGNGDMLLGGSVPICRLQGAFASKDDYEGISGQWAVDSEQ